MGTPTDDIAAVLAARSTSPRLRVALQSALRRGDPVSAANDATELARLLTDQVEAMIFLDQWRLPYRDPPESSSTSGL